MKNYYFIVFVIISSISITDVMAGSVKTGNPVRERSNKEAMTESVYKKFVKLQEMYSDSKFQEAKSGLLALTAKRLNGFEKAQIEQFLGFIEAALENYDSSGRHLKTAIASDALPNQAQFSMMLQLAQMYIAAGKYQQGLNALRDYYKITDEIKDTTFVLEANAYSQMDQYRKAIPILKKAISLSEKPKERWHYLLYSLHMQVSQFREASKVLEKLIQINPNKKEYWNRLSSVYFNLKKDDKALAVLVAADKNGYVKDEKERMHLFKLYAFLGIPYKAGEVLEQGLRSGVIASTYKRWDDLGKVWYSAAEMDKALSAYQEASKLASDGKIDSQIAFIYVDREDWPMAKKSLQSAIEKGGLKEKKLGNTWLLLGMTESEMGNSTAAIKALKNAANYKNSRKNALQWIDHIQNQQKQERLKAERAKSLADAAVDDTVEEQ